MGHCSVMGGSLTSIELEHWFAMCGALSYNGLDFFFKQSPDVGDCSVMDGTLSCDGLDFLLKQSPDGWGYCVVTELSLSCS